LEKNRLNVELLGRGFAWLDTGTHSALLDAAQLIETIERRQGFKVGCLEEIALKQAWIGPDSVERSARHYANTSYGDYLSNLVDNR
jgi:glucose-1-phosphate thymidylyltransferase